MKKLKQLLLAFATILLLTTAFSPAWSNEVHAQVALMPTNEHHVAELNSNMPYIAGFHVNADDLSQRENVNATSVAVDFSSVDSVYFSTGSWLGTGMFVQAQDHFFLNVDYGFYMMVVIDASGRVFVDVGLHQTEEETPPIQTATSSLVYSYTWLLENVDKSTPINLYQTWIDNASVRYSISVSESKQVLADVDVVDMPNCGNIIPKFYTGNVVVDQFPLSRYVNYFQFGIVSDEVIDNPHWKVDILNPVMLRSSGWAVVDKAWLLEGDRSFLDHDLMWGGAAYPGIFVNSSVEQSENLYEASFSYAGNGLAHNMTLWNVPATDNPVTRFGVENQDLTESSRRFLPVIITLIGATIVTPVLIIRHELRKKHLPHQPLLG